VKKLLLFVALSAALALGVAAPAHADGDVEDFEFSSFHGEYRLSTDADGRSVLKTIETLNAEFPQSDQNHGIIRALVDNYNGHPVDLEIESVTDENGNPREYETDSEDEFTVLTIQDEDVFVHGSQSYVITYTQHNVTRYFDDNNSDEFYWDVNGTGWAQPFKNVSATVFLEDDLAAASTGVDSFYGAEGENDQATIDEFDEGYTFSASDLGPGENLSFAIGFEPGTFVERDGSFFAAPWPTLSLIGAAGAVLVAIFALVARRTRLADAPGRGVIVAEYMPPKESIQLSALLSSTVAKSTPAHIVKLAVAGNLRILEITGTKQKYQLEFLTADGADTDDRTFLHALFGKQLTPGEDRSLDKVDEAAAKKITKLQAATVKRAVKDGYRRKVSYAGIGWLFALSLVLGVAGVVFAIASLVEAYGGAIPVAFIVTSVAGLIATWVLLSKTPLEREGVELRDYLLGLKLYISLAEADRLRYLQSPEGAITTPIATDDAAQLVKLNERLLPYAILFGEEKEWTKQLGKYYDDLGVEPQWYSGSAAFNTAVFASSIGSLSSSVTTAYTGSSSSSGSSGGGFSGGGGGGGGGGGV